MSRSALADMNSKKGDMPLPPGLLPVGNMQKMSLNPGNSAAAMSGIPKPSSSVFGKSAGVQALQSAYDPLEWSDFFNDKQMVDDVIPVYSAGTEG